MVAEKPLILYEKKSKKTRREALWKYQKLNKKKCRNSKDLNVGTDTAPLGGSIFKNFILFLPFQIIFFNFDYSFFKMVLIFCFKIMLCMHVN